MLLDEYAIKSYAVNLNQSPKNLQLRRGVVFNKSDPPSIIEKQAGDLELRHGVLHEKGKNDPTRTTNPGKGGGKNPASGCDNCTGGFSLGKIGCELGKVSCEFTTSVMGTSNAFQEGILKGSMPIIVIGAIVLLVLVVLVFKRR